MSLVKVQIAANAFVTLQYVLKDDEGDVIDSSEGGHPIEYVHGYGMLVPGLEARLLGLAVGDEKLIVVTPEEGFGDYDEELVLECERGEFPADVKEGDEFTAEDDDGEESSMVVMEVHDDRVIVDGNHPLAGQTLHYEIKVELIRAATDTEIAEAAADFDAARDESGVEDPARAGLVELGLGGKKQPNLPN
jgi:FKBP-type peptidyl-prolyl cis-trans isomerase SlyD